MKRLTILPIISFALIAVSAEANDGQSCLAQTKEFKYQKRTIFLTKCLAKAGKRENVYVETLRHKFQRCDQNAKNLALKEQAKGDYINVCLSKSDAAEKVASFRVSTKLASRTAPNSANRIYRKYKIRPTSPHKVNVGHLRKFT
jgi:hypothetical protein